LVVDGFALHDPLPSFFLFGVKYAAASDDSLVIGVGPVLIAILASFVLNEPLTRIKVLGLLSDWVE